MNVDRFLNSVRANAEKAGVFAEVKLDRGMLACLARDAAEEAWYRIEPAAHGGWSVSLDGTQPESVELMWTYSPVTGGRCTLNVKLHGAIEGLKWTVERHAPERTRLGLEFQAPPGLSAVRIALRYERPAGSMRREAAIEIERAGVSCQP